jgi:hypothetical protein
VVRIIVRRERSAMDCRCMAETIDPAPPPSAAPAEPAQKKLRFPTAFTVLAAVLLLVWVASFFVPAGAYEVDPETNGPIPGTYRELPSCSQAQGDALCVETSFDQRLKQLWIAPPNGLYGIENDRGFVSADEQGFLYGSAMIFLFVLAVGAFITVTMRTGSIQTGIGRLALRFRHTGSLLIAILMGVFALGGTSYGMWEETLGFFVLLVPLTLALGYDRMVAAAIIFLGAGAIRSATPGDLAGSQFAEGSMAPKVQAACWFAERSGGFAAIGSIHDTQALLRGEAGTRVSLDAVPTG